MTITGIIIATIIGVAGGLFVASLLFERIPLRVVATVVAASLTSTALNLLVR